MKILLTGGSGLLGKSLLPLLKQRDGDGTLYPRIEVDAPSSKELDITKPITRGEYDLIIHSAAYTDVVRAEKDRDECFNVNVVGTENLVDTYKDVPFVYISSEYAHNPVNHYSNTKWLGELVAMQAKCLVIRTLFKPKPFPYLKAFSDQYTQGDYVEVIAPLIVGAIFNWLGKESDLVYVGTGRKTIFELAKQTNPDVLPASVDDITSVKLPKDYE